MNDSQILLQELVEAVKNLDGLVEAVNRPDWWAIGITAVNALFLGWLAWRQYQLQKQQTKAQEYKLYRELYDLILNIDWLIGNFLRTLYVKFCK